MVDAQDLVSSARIVGRYGTLLTSSGDADRSPDEAPISGTVTFTPTVQEITVTSTTPYLQLVLDKFTATLDADGNLTDGDQAGIYLPNPGDGSITPRNWGYRVDYALDYLGSKRALGSFTFTFAGTTDVDLGAVTPLATVNGVAVTQGPRGDPGSGVKLRGTITGTSSAVLPTGYGAAQDGFAFRVRSANGSYDELWVWAWSGTAGAWTDAGPFTFSGLINDSAPATTSTYSSSKIAQLIAGQQAYTDSQVTALKALLGNVMIAVTRNSDGTWAAPNGFPNAYLMFLGTGDFTDIPTQYLQDGRTGFEAIDG